MGTSCPSKLLPPLGLKDKHCCLFPPGEPAAWRRGCPGGAVVTKGSSHWWDSTQKLGGHGEDALSPPKLLLVPPLAEVNQSCCKGPDCCRQPAVRLPGTGQGEEGWQMHLGQTE